MSLAALRDQINNQQYLNLARNQRGHTEIPGIWAPGYKTASAFVHANSIPCMTLGAPQYPPITQRRCVNLDEASTVDEHLGSHVAHGNQLGPVLQTCVVLF